jgi:hypothetical protein
VLAHCLLSGAGRERTFELVGGETPIAEAVAALG